MARETDFNRDEAIHLVAEQHTFGKDDVGITSPLSSAYIKVMKDGNIEIHAGNGTAIAMNPNSKSIVFMADSIKFITRDEDGIRWNDKVFNDQAVTFIEPALMPYEKDTVANPYRDMDEFFYEGE